MKFHTLSTFEPHRIAELAQRAVELQAGAKPRKAEREFALGLLFLAPSLRTQTSMQRAAQRLGIDVVTLGQGLWNLETETGAVMDQDRAEHVIEAAGVLSRYVDALGVRAFPEMKSWETDSAEPVWNAFAEHADVPLINLESPRWHPCQALADRAALDALEVPKDATLVLQWCWHPKVLPHAVANSTLCMAAQRGMNVIVNAPRGYELADDVYARARLLAGNSGGSVEFTSDPELSRSGHVVVAKSWGARTEWGSPAGTPRHSELRPWRITPDSLNSQARFMHCLPVRRNVVVDDAVLDSPASAVLLQAEMRLHAQTALLESLLASTNEPRRADALQLS